MNNNQDIPSTIIAMECAALDRWIHGDAAVLTFNYVSYLEENEDRWNCTEVYRRNGDRWQIIQTHWSYTQRV